MSAASLFKCVRWRVRAVRPCGCGGGAVRDPVGPRRNPWKIDVRLSSISSPPRPHYVMTIPPHPCPPLPPNPNPNANPNPPNPPPEGVPRFTNTARVDHYGALFG